MFDPDNDEPVSEKFPLTIVSKVFYRFMRFSVYQISDEQFVGIE